MYLDDGDRFRLQQLLYNGIKVSLSGPLLVKVDDQGTDRREDCVI